MKFFAFGSNGRGQLGIGHENDSSEPEPCIGLPEELEAPLQLVAAGNSTSMIFDEGNVFSAGFGLISTDASTADGHQTRFTKTSLPNEYIPKLCSASWEAINTVTESDDVLVFGRGSKGELGLGEQVVACDEPVKMESFLPHGTKIIDIASGPSHTVAVLSNGDIYGWGNGRKGQLGISMEIIWQPRRIGCVPFKAVRAVCGRDFTCVVGDGPQRPCLLLGSDKWGIRSRAPQVLGDYQAIGASWQSMYVLNASGELRSWGRNDRGQLPPLGLPKLAAIAVGSEHVVALTKEANEVISWGWGEHGNCGGEVDEHGNVAGRWNTIQLHNSTARAKILGVGAGCATSFVWAEAD